MLRFSINYARWRGTVLITLVYSAHDEKHNDAVELRKLILRQ